MYKYRKNNGARFQLYSAICACLMLAILVVTTVTLKKDTPVMAEQSDMSVHTEYQTEYIYVYVPATTTPADSTQNTDESNGWLIREYNGQIGVFSSEGAFLRIIDVHIKTLPVADRELLREGITVSTRKELLAVIEDYTG